MSSSRSYSDFSSTKRAVVFADRSPVGFFNGLIRRDPGCNGRESPTRASALGPDYLPCSAPSAAPRENGLGLCDIGSRESEARAGGRGISRQFSRGAAEVAEGGRTRGVGLALLALLRALRGSA